MSCFFLKKELNKYFFFVQTISLLHFNEVYINVVTI
jgi:hypothetical protein